MAFAGIVIVGLASAWPLGLTTADTPLAPWSPLLVAMGVGHGLLDVAYTDIVTDTLPRARPRRRRQPVRC